MSIHSTIPTATVILWTLWGLVVAAIVGCWWLMMAGHPDGAMAVGFTAIAMAAAAGTASVRVMTGRLADLARTLHGYTDCVEQSVTDGADMRQLRPM